ncbi:MAG: hypothetical protein H8E10_00240 [Desulfobacterales bacterium]|nr:hypothetical protein [Desulfobacterales bacterium]
MKYQRSLDMGILVCVECGKFVKLEDLPCSCGNGDYFINLEDCSLLFFKDISVENEFEWASESVALSA